MAEWIKKKIKKTQLYAAYKKFTSVLRHTYAQSEGLRKDIPGKWKPKESEGRSTYIRQNRL